MKLKTPEPVFKTPSEQLCKEEINKLASGGFQGELHEHLRDLSADNVIWDTEQLAKSHGIYLEYNRAKTGRDKDWMYMLRVSVPGGGAFNREQWRVFDELSRRYTADLEGRPSLRITTRQNVQFHWVKKTHLVEIVRRIAETGFFTMNGCGDNIRNIMGCPLSRFSSVHDANALARKFGAYFRLPAEAHVKIFAIDPEFLRTPDTHFAYGPNLLNRKFKIAFSAVHRDPQTGRWLHDNCVELRTNEIGVAPVVEHDKVAAYQVYLGGGQGEKNGKPTFAAHGQPLGIFTEVELLKGLDAVVHVHQEWGDRKNRHWARMKYLVHDKGIDWFRNQIRDRGGVFEPPRPGFDPGPRMMHHGWQLQPSNGLMAYGAYIENGRLIDGPDGRLQSMVRHLMDTFDGLELMTTPNQDLLFTNVAPDATRRFEQQMSTFGYGRRNGKPYSRLRVLSGACVGLHTCRLAYTESEQFEPELIDELERRGYGDLNESIGITGCERQCFRPATKSIGWVGQGPNLYGLKVGGSEDGRHQGQWLSDSESWYLKQVPRAQVATVTAALFDFYELNRRPEESDLGAFHRRIGSRAVIDYLTANPDIGHLMEKTFDAPFQPGAGNE